MTGSGPTSWSLARRVGFRALAIYFVLYTFPFPLDRIPWLGGPLSFAVGSLQKSIAVAVAPWIGIERELYLGPTGSGDTTVAYVLLLVQVLTALGVTALWSLIDRRPRSYAAALPWLVRGVRFYLGLTMLGYGFAKVIPTQFTSPGLVRLLTPYGESSPMGLVWTFMGFSPAYTVFAGLAEVLGGVLLFFRRTRTLGAAVTTAVMTNVAMMNYAYDVPVKLYSSHLLAMAIGLLLLDGRRLAALFLLNRPAPAAELPPPFGRPRLDLGVAIAKVAFLVWMVGQSVDGGLEVYRSFGAGRERPPLWGVHDVESFRLDGEELPPLATDPVRWRALVVDRPLPLKLGTFERPGSVAVWQMDGSFSHHSIELDTEAGTITVLPPEGSEEGVEPEVLTYSRPEPERLIVEGGWHGSRIEVEMRLRDPESMPLTSRGFHWINELPYNR